MRLPGAAPNIRFVRDAGTDRVLAAMQAFKGAPAGAPGRDACHRPRPAPGGSALPMELRGVAYDAELVAEVRRRVGEGVIDFERPEGGTAVAARRSASCSSRSFAEAH